MKRITMLDESFRKLKNYILCDISKREKQHWSTAYYNKFIYNEHCISYTVELNEEVIVYEYDYLGNNQYSQLSHKIGSFKLQ